MKRLFFIIHFLIVICYSARSQPESKTENRELLKEHFLCCCLDYAFEHIGISKIDNSKSVYFDILKYKLPAMQKVDSLAKIFVDSIELSGYEGKTTKGVIMLSIDEYKSPELNTFVKSMDNYMIN